MNYREKRDYFHDLEHKYYKHGTISGQTFINNQHEHRKKVVYVDNDTFKEGTLRVTVPCLIKLKEDINFNPNRNYNWFPSAEVLSNEQYFKCDAKFAYNLGFFAAIAIESCDVIIDLNGRTLQQHEEHALEQRFYANIELADQPVIPMQGPSNFGTKLIVGHRILIHNGTLGRSSHHGIHGNGSHKVMIENVIFKDFEVGGISINNVNDLDMYKINMTNNRQNVPVLGTYLGARFVKICVEKLKKYNITSLELEAAMNQLNIDMVQTFNSVINNIGSIPKLFKNESQLVDGNAYGILLNGKGVANNGLEKSSTDTKTNNIHISNCKISNIMGNVREILALSYLDTVQVDTAGSVLQFFNGMYNDIDKKLFYKGTSLSNVQIELAKLKENLPLDNHKYFGTLNIHKGIQDWKTNSSLYFRIASDHTVKLYSVGDVPYELNGQHVSYKIVCSKDTMNQLNKGVIACKLEGIEDLYINKLTITDVKNSGEVGSLLCGSYINSGQVNNSIIGYQGAMAYGLLACTINTMLLKDVLISNIESKNASAYGLTIMNDSVNVECKRTKVMNILSNVEGTFEPSNNILPNEVPISRGLYVGHNCKNIEFECFELSKVKNNIGNPYHLDYDIHSQLNFN